MWSEKEKTLARSERVTHPSTVRGLVEWKVLQEGMEEVKFTALLILFPHETPVASIHLLCSVTKAKKRKKKNQILVPCGIHFHGNRTDTPEGKKYKSMMHTFGNILVLIWKTIVLHFHLEIGGHHSLQVLRQ